MMSTMADAARVFAEEDATAARRGTAARGSTGSAVPLSTSPYLERLDPATTRALNLLYRRRPAARIPMGREVPPTLLTWAHLPTCTDAAWAWYDFRIGPTHGRLGLDNASQKLLFRDARFGLYPPELRLVLLADLLAPLVEQVERIARQPLEWLVQPHDPAATACGWASAGFRLTRPGEGGSPTCGCLELENGEGLEAYAMAMSLPPQSLALGGLRMDLSMVVGNTTLTLRELRSVCPGDLIAVDQWQSQDSVLICRVVVGRHVTRLKALVDDTRVTLMNWKGSAMAASDNDQSPVEGEVEAVALDRLDALDVQLRFEAGHLRVPLRELRSLQPGHVFELDEPINRGTVRIYAQGNLLGHGHLVGVGERLGVRVASITRDLHD